MKVGYLADLFDLLNVRDLDVIQQAREHCERLVVGVFTDELAEQLFGQAPVVPFAERLELVSHVRGVDEVRTHDPEALDGGWVVFRLSDRAAYAGGGGPWLSPRVVTSSEVLARVLTFGDRSVA